MKKALLFFIVWCGALSMFTAGAQSWQWARSSMCSSFLGGSEGFLVKADPYNNVYMAGFYYGDSVCVSATTYYNPINPTNNVQTLIVKYDSTGTVLWSKAGKHGQSRPIAITTDHKGNMYVFGYFTTDSIRFDEQLLINTGFDHLHPLANSCYYLLKFDEEGTLLWSDNGNGNIHPDGDYLKAGGMAADASGDIYIASTFNSDTLKIGTNRLINTNAADSTDDIFIAKYNTSGNVLWAKSFGGSKDDFVLDVASNGSKIFLGGYFTSGFINFGGNILYNSRKKGYVASMDINGNVLWARNTGSKGKTRCVAPDKKGNVYVSGGFTDTLGFDTYNIINNYGGYYLTRFDSTGNMQTPKILKPVNQLVSCCDVYSITTDACNDVWISINMEAGKGISIDNSTTVYPPNGSQDPTMFVGYNAAGALIDHVELKSGGGYNTGLSNTGLSADNRGNIFFTGDFRILDPFVVGSDSLHLYGGQQTNIFVAKYKPLTDCVDPEQPVYPSVPVIKIYPDPARYETVLSYTGDLGIGATMTLRDITGRMIHVYPLTTQLTPFSVADLAQGTYLCMIHVAGREIYTLRLVVVR